MTKTEFLNYARNEMQGWCYVWIDRGEEGIGLHELYGGDGKLGWTEEPVAMIGDVPFLNKILDEVKLNITNGLIFTEQELQCR